MSFMRASLLQQPDELCERHAHLQAGGISDGDVSTLNYLIDAPLEEILEQIPLCAEAKEGLLHHTGRCGMLYDLALSYERANWARIDELAEGLGIPTNLLTSLYFSCMEEVNRVWNEITRPEPSQLEAGLAEERGT